MAIIRVRDLHTRFGERWVHQGVNLDVEKGETMLVIGGSGSGKSVLFKSLLGLVRPVSGSIEIYQKEITQIKEREMNEIRNRLGVLFQGSALFDSMTVGENVGFVLERDKSFTPKEIRRIVDEKLDQVGLKEIQNYMPNELSGGMQKRVALARAIVKNPEIILYDEPTTALDPIMANIINDLIIQLQEELKVSSIVVTHDMNSAFRVGNRMALLHHGKIIALGTLKEMQESKNVYVQQFIQGSSEGPMSLIGTVLNPNSDMEWL